MDQHSNNELYHRVLHKNKEKYHFLKKSFKNVQKTITNVKIKIQIRKIKIKEYRTIVRITKENIFRKEGQTIKEHLS